MYDPKLLDCRLPNVTAHATFFTLIGGRELHGQMLPGVDHVLSYECDESAADVQESNAIRPVHDQLREHVDDDVQQDSKFYFFGR